MFTPINTPSLTTYKVMVIALAIAALLEPVAGFLTPSLGKGSLAVRHPVLGQHLALRTCPLMPMRTNLRVGMCGEGATAEKYSETKAELVRKYRGYLEGTIDTDGEVLPEWRIDNRQVKLEAQGITAETAPRRAGIIFVDFTHHHKMIMTYRDKLLLNRRGNCTDTSKVHGQLSRRWHVA